VLIFLLARVTNVFYEEYENFGLLGESPDEIRSNLSDSLLLFSDVEAQRGVGRVEMSVLTLGLVITYIVPTASSSRNSAARVMTVGEEIRKGVASKIATPFLFLIEA
jgi:hypothetical protein